MERKSHQAALLRDTTRYIYICHPERELWCAHGCRWTPNRHEALMFTSNIDALTFCSAMNLYGVIAAFSVSGTLLYELEVSALVQSFAAL